MVDETVIAKLARHSIMCVSIKEEIDYATTHFEKVRLSTEFKYFEFTYNDCMPIYRKLMTDFVEQGIPVRMNRLMELYVKISSCARNGEQLLDFLYNMLPSEDDMTHAHCLNSALIAGVFGTWLSLSKEDIFLLIQCGFFYDIGKLKLPQELLWKPGKLTELEFTKLKTHTMLGFDLLKEQNLNEHVIKATLMHHERCDGSGYPNKLKKDMISRFGRVLAILDIYDAMAGDRVCAKRRSPFDVFSILYDDILNGRLDTEYGVLFIKHLCHSLNGNWVSLSNGKKGRIVYIDESRVTALPVVQTTDGEFINLNTKRDVKVEAILTAAEISA